MGEAGADAGSPEEAIAEDAGDSARLRKHSVVVAGHRTSLSLENIFWRELKAMAAARSQSLNALIAEIDAERSGNLSSAVRVWVVERLRSKTFE